MLISCTVLSVHNKTQLLVVMVKCVKSETDNKFCFISGTECPESEAKASMKVVCYYPNWPYYRQGDGKYTVEDIDTSICTHIMYSFVVLDPNTHKIKIHDDWLDVQLGNIKKFTDLKAANPGVKFMLALGGWTDSRKEG
jgi:GH18 family chitinase